MIKSRSVSFRIFCGDCGGGVEAECFGKQPLEYQEGDWSRVIILVTGRSCGDVTREVVYHLRLGITSSLLQMRLLCMKFRDFSH